MRIRFVTGRQSHWECINIPMLHKIKENVAANGWLPVDEDPDIIHVFGCWDRRSYATVSKARKLGIPTVFTSMDGLQSLAYYTKKTAFLARRIRIRSIARTSSAVHTGGKVEAELLKSVSPKARTYTVANPYITNMESEHKMAEDIINMYDGIIRQHEADVNAKIGHTIEKADIEDKSISLICTKLLYLHYLYNRRYIPQTILDDLADTMMHSQYDEDIMGEKLTRLKIRQFASSLFYAASEKSFLTEGFIPVPYIHDKMAEEIIKTIKNYQQ